MPLDFTQWVPGHDVVFVTLDTLRYDVACKALSQGRLPTLARWLPNQMWERRHSPASFTYAAHQAFFAGFLPTPATPGRHPRVMAARFEGSETTHRHTLVFDTSDIVSGFASLGYHTVCVGGVGFFNKKTPLGCVLPALFAESHWSDEMGVASVHSPEAQITCALDALSRLDVSTNVFLFVNISALHQPNCIFTPGATHDTPDTQATALHVVDRELARLFQAVSKRGTSLWIVCSDHGTAYGEDGYHGHRLAHESVWTVPYAEFIVPANEG